MLMIPTAHMQGPTPLHIGDTYAGGLVAYLTGSFPYQSGFVVSFDWVPTIDISHLGYQWCPNGLDIPSASGSAIGTGMINTQYIAAAVGNDPNYAAVAALNYNGGGYNDWFLPSHDEFEQICLQHGNNPGTQPGYLGHGNWVSLRLSWTSTQYRKGFPYSYDVRDGVINCTGGQTSWAETTRFNVRPIRYFTYDITNTYENLPDYTY